MDGQTLAAWVQAVGSILAIVAAFLISFLLHKSTLKALQTRRRDTNVNKLAVLFALAEKTRTLIEKANTGVQDGFTNSREREFDSNDLHGLHEAFANVVLHELPTA